jgi:hypothetical protein
MTKDEAVEAMNKGHKVTHRFMESHEYIERTPDYLIRTEEGYTCQPSEFWRYRQGEAWETDWSIVEETTKTTKP